MKKWLFAWGVLILLFGALAYSQTSETFSNYVAGLPAATTPLAPGDTLYVLQGGQSKSVTNNNLILPCPTATSSVLGCVKPDGVTITATPTGVISSSGGGGGGGTNLGWVIATAAPFNATGNGTTDDTAAIQAAIDFAAVNGISTIYLPKPGTCYKTTAPIYLDPPTNMRVNFNSPPTGAFSLGLIGEPGTAGNHEDSFGSKICPGAGYPVIIVGTGQGMKVSNLTIHGTGGGQAAAYRCGRIPNSPPETGIYIAGGGPGASRTLIEQVLVENVFYGIAVGLNNGSLGDSNSFRKITIDNTCNGIIFGAQQNFINDCIECTIVDSATAINAFQGGGITVVGGNMSANVAKAVGVMTLSAYSAVTATPNGANFDFTFTATLGAPAFSGVTSYSNGDVVSSGGQVWYCINFGPACTGTTPSLAVPSTWEPIVNYIGTGAGGILGSWSMVTAHYGVIPMTMTSFTQATGAIAFKIWSPWSFFYFPQFNAVTNGDLTAEVQGSTALYAAEQDTVFIGAGINATGVHVENSGAPTQLISTTTSLNGAAGDKLTDIRFNFSPTAVGSLAGNPASKARFYTSVAFPLISMSNIGLEISNSSLGQNQFDPYMVDVNLFQASGRPFRMDASNFQYDPMAQRAYSNGGFNLPGSINGSSGFLYGEFDIPPFSTSNNGGGGGADQGVVWRETGGRSPHWGTRPAPAYHPCIRPAQFTTLSGALPAWNTSGGFQHTQFGYPFISGGQVYAICDWFVGVQTHYLFESTHHFYSMGQNMTTTNVPGLSWNYKGQGAWVYADAGTLSLVFPGLGVTLNDGSSDILYMVTGVWPSLGYFTVVRGDSASGGQLSGGKTAIITGTLIKQEAYSFVFP